MIRHLLADYPAWERLGLSLGLALVVSFLVAEVAARGMRVGLRALLGRQGHASTDRALVKPVRYARMLAFAAVFVTLFAPALEVAGYQNDIGLDPEVVVDWFVGSGVRILLVGGLAWLIVRVAGVVLVRIEREIAESNSPDADERSRRVRTLGNLVHNVVAVLVTGTAGLMILRELRIDVMPILTGAGIVGLAVGFGAQTLVKDVISGFFIILENQVRVGDVAVINGTGGVVESITLRTIVLRDVEGTVHVFPAGGITTLANRSKDYSYAVLDVTVVYREDTDRVMQVLREIGDGMRGDAALASLALEPLEVLGIDAFGDAGVVIRTRMKTLPLKQWEAARELRRRVKQRFDAEGIEISNRHSATALRAASDAAHAGQLPPSVG